MDTLPVIGHTTVRHSPLTGQEFSLDIEFNGIIKQWGCHDCRVHESIVP